MKVAKDEVKLPDGPPARGEGLEGPYTFCIFLWLHNPQECLFYGVLIRLFLVNEFYGLDKN